MNSQVEDMFSSTRNKELFFHWDTVWPEKSLLALNKNFYKASQYKSFV